jgi:protein transport protein SEC24
MMVCCVFLLQTDSATGPALQAAFMVMGSIGGKLLLFQAASPSVGVGRIKNRDLPTLYGTDRHATCTHEGSC